MAIANTTIQVRKSGTTGVKPTSLANGELALNFADDKLYYKNNNGNISYFYGANNGPSFSTANANNVLLLATAPNDTLSIVPGNNITISACTTTKTVTINSTNSTGDSTAAFAQANAAFDKANSAGSFANGAFTTANNALANTGSLITVNGVSQFLIANTLTSTSNSTGALVVKGGVGVSGNVTVNNYVTVTNTAGGISGHMAYNSTQSSIDFTFF